MLKKFDTVVGKFLIVIDIDTEEAQKSMITFFDSRYDGFKTSTGYQMITKYYLEDIFNSFASIVENHLSSRFELDGGVSEWWIKNPEIHEIYGWILNCIETAGILI